MSLRAASPLLSKRRMLSFAFPTAQPLLPAFLECEYLPFHLVQLTGTNNTVLSQRLQEVGIVSANTRPKAEDLLDPFLWQDGLEETFATPARVCKCNVPAIGLMSLLS